MCSVSENQQRRSPEPGELAAPSASRDSARLARPYELQVVGEYIDNLSGKYSNNWPGYQQMLVDTRAGLFSHVAVENAERFGRNDSDARTAIDELNELGIAVRFADYPDLDPIDPDDRILVSLSFTLARHESIKLGQRVQGGLHAKLRGGGFTGKAPDGYRNCEEKAGQLNRDKAGRYARWIEPDPEQSVVWRTAWDMLLTDRYTLAEICDELHVRGYGYRFRSGRPFVFATPNGKRTYSTNGLSRIFRNWSYAGWVVSESAGIAPRSIRGNWEPLVTTAAFEHGLEILARRSKKSSRSRKNQYLLSGLIFLEYPKDRYLVRMTCSISNPGRSYGGTRHYRVAHT